jgi:hypothetical protein
MATTFGELLVPLDLSATADRALPVARSLWAWIRSPIHRVAVVPVVRAAP